jgi:nicotinamidase-related amidase
MKEIWGKSVCETLEEVLDPDRCVVLSVDLQNDMMKPEGKIAKSGKDITPMIEVLPRCAAFIAEARSRGVPVVHLRHVALPEGKSDSPAWIRTKQKIMGQEECFVEGTWGAEISDECKPLANEPVVAKFRSNAFVNSNLDSILRASGAETVVVIGESTHGCVEATYRDAGYRDYYTVLVEDCVAALIPQFHEATLAAQRARHDVCSADEVFRIWREARGAEGAHASDLEAQLVN